jgi:membrane protease YdiL (CAAX protease family)
MLARLARHNASAVGTPGSVARRAGFHPVLAVVLAAAGWVSMLLSIALAQVALQQGVSLGVRTLLVAAQLFLVLPSLVALLAARGPLRETLALVPIDRRLLVVALCAGAALWAASVGLLQAQSLRWPPTEEFLETFRRLHAALRPQGPFDGIVSVVAIAVVPATCEEIVFRGVVLPSFQRVLAAPLAVLASALLFGVIHVDATPAGLAFTRIPFAIFVGTALGALRVRSGSLVPPMVAHALLNTITFLTVVATGVEAETETAEAALAAALLVGGSALTVMALRHARPPLTPPGPPPRVAA